MYSSAHESLAGVSGSKVVPVLFADSAGALVLLVFVIIAFREAFAVK